MDRFELNQSAGYNPDGLTTIGNLEDVTYFELEAVFGSPRVVKRRHVGWSFTEIKSGKSIVVSQDAYFAGLCSGHEPQSWTVSAPRSEVSPRERQEVQLGRLRRFVIGRIRATSKKRVRAAVYDKGPRLVETLWASDGSLNPIGQAMVEELESQLERRFDELSTLGGSLEALKILRASLNEITGAHWSFAK